MRDAPRPRPALIGREEQLERMMSRLSSAYAGEGHLLLITGEAGVGKTRLAVEFEAMVSNVPCLRASAECARDSPPFAPFIELLCGLSRIEPTLSVHPAFQRLVPVSGGASHEALSAERGEEALFAILDAVRSASERLPLVLRLEDLHLADARTIQTLHFLARGLEGSRALLIATCSDDELFDRKERPHPLIEAVRIMKREGLCEEIHLPPLSKEQLAEVLASLLEMELEPTALDALFHESGGNPQIAVELAREALHSGALVLGPGIARMNSWRSPAIPPSLMEWVGWKLESLPEEHLGLLECAAVCGDSFDAGLMARALGMRKLEVLELVDAAVRRFRLYVEEGEGFRFRWGVVKTVAVERMTAERVRFLSATVEEARENQRDSGGAPEDA